MHHVAANGHNYLLDCGQFQGRRQEANERNANLPFEAASLALENHVKELVRCIPKRQQPSASAAAAANSHVTCHAAFIAFQRGKTLQWDPAKAEFTNDEIANRMRARAMREPWRV